MQIIKKPDLSIFDKRLPFQLKSAEIYDPTKFTILTGSDGVLDDLFSYQVYNWIKNHWRAAAAPADKQPGMIRSDSDDDKVHHYGAAAWEEILQLTRSSDVTPTFLGLLLAEYITHVGDADTYIRFQPDQITLRAGGVDFINMVEAATDYLQLLNGLNFIGENANAFMTVGLTIKQGGSEDDEILAFKSSDIAVGVTDRTETDTFGRFLKASASKGALQIEGFGEENYGLVFYGIQDADIGAGDSKGATGIAPIMLQVGKKSGTGVGNMTANYNIVVMRGMVGGSMDTRWLVDEDGDTWQGGMLTAQGLIVSAPTELTIAAGVITVTKSYHTVDTQGNDATDDLDTINGGVDGYILIIRPIHTDRTINVTEAGNIRLDGVNRLMNNYWQTLMLIYDATLSLWLEVSYGQND